ncbi:MAG: prephenate dehydrogenase [Lachnospiraceae bacterium]|nr:prephenate dehydrogenase [Lachnospiraceae bacterium]
MRKLTIGFIGLGLIGGSMARTLKYKNKDIKIIAYNRSKKPLEDAVSDHVIDVAAPDIDETFSDCDYIFLCAPVEYNSMYLKTLSGIISNKTIITDVGSVKGYIHNTVRELGISKHFIGGHPMAGSERTGYANANEHLFENAYYAITPTDETDPDRLAEYKELVSLLGAIPIVIDPDVHDYCVAGISHLPHIVASSLVNTVRVHDTDEETMKMLAAGGFKDITRIASSSPEMWEQICMTNTDRILELIAAYEEQLEVFKLALNTKDSNKIHGMFEQSRDYRNSINTVSKGLLDKVYVLRCELVDEKGQIANIAGILAKHDISLKNIGIINNRENEKGVLHIELSSEDDLINATTLLRDNSYTVYR